jgi:hypothetical protein
MERREKMEGKMWGKKEEKESGVSLGFIRQEIFQLRSPGMRNLYIVSIVLAGKI